MAATLKVRTITKMDVQADNSTVLDVEFEILENGQALETRHLNFPLTSTKDEIQAGLQDCINTYNADRENAKKNEELELAHIRADQTIADLTGAELQPADSFGEQATSATDTQVSTDTPAQEAAPTDQAVTEQAA